MILLRTLIRPQGRAVPIVVPVIVRVVIRISVGGIVDTNCGSVINQVRGSSSPSARPSAVAVSPVAVVMMIREIPRHVALLVLKVEVYKYRRNASRKRRLRLAALGDIISV